MKKNMKTAGAASVAAAALAIGGIASVAPYAFADQPADDGKITITKVNDATVTYGAYKLFNGTVDSNNLTTEANGHRGEITNVSLAGTPADTLSVLDAAATATFGPYNAETDAGENLTGTALKRQQWHAVMTEANASKKAQLAAEFVANNIDATDTVPDAPNGDTYGGNLAMLVKAFNGGAGLNKETATLTTGTSQTYADGYYVFIAEGTNGQENQAGSGAIYAVVGGDDVTISEKTGIPTVTKEIQEDSTGAWGADANYTITEKVPYKLTGKVAANIDDYDTYAYKFVDTPSAGVTVADTDAAAAVVTIDGKVVKSGYTASISEGKLIVSFADLKAAQYHDNDADEDKVIPITKDSKIVVTYSGTLNDAAAINKPNTNDVYVEYSNNPYTTDKGVTTHKNTDVFTHSMQIVKMDSQANTVIKDEVAQFTITTEDGKYLTHDANGRVSGIVEVAEGATVPGAAIWSTNNGVINVIGVDADKYVITETKAPNGYTGLTESFEVTVTADITATSATVDMTVPTGNTLIAKGDSVAIANADADSPQVKVGNYKGIQLPATGQMGFMLLTLGGGAIIVLALGGTIIRKRRAAAEELDED